MSKLSNFKNLSLKSNFKKVVWGQYIGWQATLSETRELPFAHHVQSQQTVNSLMRHSALHHSEHRWWLAWLTLSSTQVKGVNKKKLNNQVGLNNHVNIYKINSKTKKVYAKTEPSKTAEHKLKAKHRWGDYKQKL